MVGCQVNSGRLGHLGDFGGHHLDQEGKGVLQSGAQVDDDKDVPVGDVQSIGSIAGLSEGSCQKGEVSGKVEVTFIAVVVPTRHVDSTAHQ